MHTDTQTYAEHVCTQLLQDCPDLEIYHEDPEVFFDGFFTDFGMPDGPDYYPIHFECGRALYLEAEPFYQFNHTTLGFQPSEDTALRPFLALFIHEEGFIAEVDQTTGHMHKLFATPPPEHLADYLKLFFETGRAQLQQQDARPARLERMLVPFFQYPDDFSTDYSEMPLVPFDRVKDLIDTHILAGTPWLLAMQDLQPRINEFRRKAADHPSDFGQQRDAIDGGSGWKEKDPIPENGWELFVNELTEKNDQRTKDRPPMIQHANQLPESDFTNWHESPRLVQWSMRYHHLGGENGWPRADLPLALDFSGPVFTRMLDKSMHPQFLGNVLQVIKQAFWGNPDYCLPYEFKLPRYIEQVENAFIQETVIYKAPILADKVVTNPGKDEDNHHNQLQRRMEAWHALQALLGRTSQAS